MVEGKGKIVGVAPAGFCISSITVHSALDKKALSGELRLILWHGLGQAEVVSDVPELVIRLALS